MIKSVKIESGFRRAWLIAACLLCLTIIFFFVRWCFAHTIAAFAPNKEVAEWSVNLAPADPQTHYALAVLNEKTFAPEDSAKSLVEYERAAALAPHDYRLWLAFGKARERSGDAAGAELTLRKSLALAPNYAPVQWTLGNALLRHGKTAEGFAEMTRAAENDPAFRTPLANTAWQIFDGDIAAVRRNLGDSVNINFALVSFLAKKKRFVEAVQIWNDLPVENKKTTFKSEGEQLFGEVLAAKKYRDALRIEKSISDKPEAAKFAPGKIFNGDFETALARDKASVFDWQIADGAQPQIGPNNEQKHGGGISLLFIFNSSDGKDFRQVSQTVVVESPKKYALEFFYKAELKTSATLRWEIADAADGKILASSNPILNSTDWTNAGAEFTTAAATEAVIVRLVREGCKSSLCPIAGKVWFDDFHLKY
ncbi:MAG: hypothetical protein LH472_08055 [Pyrinomonadaceae bacterium]|nr:hypothetical protein [Pyrinomonadaceae bacterium]